MRCEVSHQIKSNRKKDAGTSRRPFLTSKKFAFVTFTMIYCIYCTVFTVSVGVLVNLAVAVEEMI